ncbi:type V CRISPR-associated protein Cas12c [uncultured Umboniibacter sp.]|uniref:type V CRISPR-associated protein Cas12c n=1 Tax=uncultured Umboniibacter sp. TaxID=1798917 RepID=UPI00262F98CF|nr:type V CRISPR-associated protein Cas12c [uncultured Umboniibacter sp.]
MKDKKTVGQERKLNWFAPSGFAVKEPGLIEKIVSETGVNLREGRAAFSGKFARLTNTEKKEGLSDLKTITVPCDNIPSQFFFDHVERDYMTLFSNNQDSLSYFLVAAHALGFRVFASSGARASYAALSVLSDDNIQIAKQLAAHNLTLPSFTASSFYSAFTTPVKGKDEIILSDAMNRLSMSLLGRLGQRNESAFKPEDVLLHRWSNLLIEQFGTWANLLNDIDGVLIALKDELSALGIYSLIASGVEKYVEVRRSLTEVGEDAKALKTSTIHFDESASNEYTEDYSLMLLAVVRRYAREGALLDANIKNYTKEAITTANGNGLGWLFNKGIKSFRTLEVSKLAVLLGVPECSLDRLNVLVDLAKNLPAVSAVDDGAVSGSRAKVQGSIDSAVANLLGRALSDLETLEAFDMAPTTEFLDELSECDDAEIARVLGAIDLTVENVSDISAEVSVVIAEATRALEVLLGRIDGDLAWSVEALARYDSASDLVGGIKGAIDGAAKRGRIAKMSSAKLPLVNRLPTFNARVPLAELRRNNRATLDVAKSEWSEVFNGLATTFSLSLDAAIDVLGQQFGGAGELAGRTTALRFVLNRLCRLAYQGSDVFRGELIIELMNQGVIGRTKKQRRAMKNFVERQDGVVFLHPLATRKKPLISLDLKVIDLTGLFAALEQKLSSVEAEKVNGLKATIMLGNLPARVGKSELPELLVKSINDDKDVASRNTIQKTISRVWLSKINGLERNLAKTQFTDKLSLSFGTKQAFALSPNLDRPWYWQSSWSDNPRLSKLLGFVVFEDEEKGLIDTRQTLKAITKLKCEAATSLRESVGDLLSSMPHKWVALVEVKGMSESAQSTVLGFDAKGFKMMKGSVTPINLRTTRYASEVQRRLSEALRGKVKLSPPSIKVVRSFTVEDQGDVKEQVHKRTLLLDVPITSVVDTSEHKVWCPNVVIGVDPAESGFGVSVVDIDSGSVLDACFISVNAITRYYQLTEKHRQAHQPKAAYRSPYSNHLELARKGAMGMVTNMLDKLILKLEGILAIESVSQESVTIRKFWEHVAQLYAFGDNGAQNDVRKQHWGGGFTFSTNLLRSVRLPTGKIAAPKPFNGGPGTTVSGAFTSSICPCCERNGVMALRSAIADAEEIEVNGGRLRFGDHVMKVDKLDQNHLDIVSSRHIERSYSPIRSMDRQIIKPGSKAEKDLVRSLHKSARRLPKYRKTTGSQYSEYHCLYEDCDYVGHADAAAAINIARRLVNSLSVDEKALEKTVA